MSAKLPFLACIAFTSFHPAQKVEIPTIPEGAPIGMRFIDQQDLKQHTFYLASDELGGRYTGTPGQRQAARYLAEHLEALGYAPRGDIVDGEYTYYQNWPVKRTYLDPLNTWLTIGEDSYFSGFGVMPGTKVKSVDLSGEIIWCGTGRKSELPEDGIEGKIPIVLLKSLKMKGGGVEAQFMMAFSRLRIASTVARRLQFRGAEAVIFLGLDDDSGIGDFINYAGITPQKHLLAFGGDAGAMAGMAKMMATDVPIVFASRRLSEKYLKELGIVLDAKGKVVSQDAEAQHGGAMKISVVVDDGYRVPNVCAYIEGSDKKAEAVVFSAHMDHMGIRLDGEVFNGADDNASGCAALLEVAEAIAKGDKPRRSVVILYVSGEELGLWGSQWYANNPTWNLDKIVANVNIDMIGRNTELSDAEEISITPSYAHKKYSSTAKDAARLASSMGLGLVIGDKFYQRSDHYNFAVKGVPVVFFCDGEHRDYHQVTDHPDKLNYDKIEKVARLAYWTGFNVAMQEELPREIGRTKDGWQGEPRK